MYQRFAKHFANVTIFALSKSVLHNIMQVVQLTSVRLPMSNDSLEEWNLKIKDLTLPDHFSTSLTVSKLTLAVKWKKNTFCDYIFMY